MKANQIEKKELKKMIPNFKLKEGTKFNLLKSHSLCYSIIGYWGAYYKTHFREHFDKAFNTEVIFE